ncbi:hypothetical protein CBOM_07993 [Ceraceosorus bombacis]|uniref:Secreted protein n=1 Tax=Ceraceosorus bombacis TaxID=401625 RepID=A0A0P1BK42_9BASI|nr:hypothetical protein CBOM_07993 [Ceraceosorus bombacis]
MGTAVDTLVIKLACASSLLASPALLSSEFTNLWLALKIVSREPGMRTVASSDACPQGYSHVTLSRNKI